MHYHIELTRKAIKDLKSISGPDLSRIRDRIDMLQNDLAGDVKKLINHTPEYRMRCGNYRVLFEVEVNKIIIYRILHRSEAYR